MLLPVLNLVPELVQRSYQVAGHMLLPPYRKENQSHVQILVGVYVITYAREKVKFGVAY